MYNFRGRRRPQGSNFDQDIDLTSQNNRYNFVELNLNNLDKGIAYAKEGQISMKLTPSDDQFENRKANSEVYNVEQNSNSVFQRGNCEPPDIGPNAMQLKMLAEQDGNEDKNSRMLGPSGFMYDFQQPMGSYGRPMTEGEFFGGYGYGDFPLPMPIKKRGRPRKRFFRGGAYPITREELLGSYFDEPMLEPQGSNVPFRVSLFDCGDENTDPKVISKGATTSIKCHLEGHHIF